MGKISLNMNRTELRRMRQNVRELPKKIDHAISATVDYDAAWGQAWMRQNAPWTDRTSAARNGLLAIPSSYARHYEILLTYSVYYGIWLEVANSGQYQILQPALRIVGAKLMRDLDGLFERL